MMRRTFLVFALLFTASGGFAPAAQNAPAAALPARPDSLKFAVIGDTGTGGRPEFDVGQQMAAARAKFPSSWS